MLSNDEQKKFKELYKIIAPGGKVFFAGTLLQRAAQLWPDRVALICEDESITYRELYLQAAHLTHKLIQAGIKKDDRVLLLWQNAIEFYIAYFGIWQTGAIVAPLNIFLHEAEINHIIADADPKALLVSDQLSKKIEIQEKNLLIFVEKDLQLRQPPAETVSINIPSKEENDLAIILYTSGTTGLPKGVMLSSKNILVNAIQGASRLSIADDERIFAALPLFHSFTENTCLWAPLLFGCTVIVVPKIDRGALLKGLAHKPTLFIGVPALYGLLCLLKDLPVHTIKLFASGSDALPAKIRAGFELLYGRRICNGYGLTETSPMISVNLDDVTARLGNVGLPFPSIDILIKDEQNKTQARGSIGTLWVKGDNVMLGYYNSPEATQGIIHDGYLNTGDLAYIDKRGNIVIVGRQKDIIISKGINVYPQEIENILASHSLITHAAVVAKKIEADEIPIAFVATQKPELVTEKELIKLCVENLAPYKIPRRVIIRKELPLTATGKVDKKQLKTDDIEL